MKRGDVVGIVGKGDFAVVEVRRIHRGKHAGGSEVFFAPLDARLRGTAYAIRGRVDRMGGATYIRKASRTTYATKDIQSAMDAAEGKRSEVQEKKEARAEAGREAMGSPWVAKEQKIHKGDIVRIAWSNGARDEECADVNYATGKIAIVARNNQSGKRWIAATLVREVKSPRRTLPYSLTMNEQMVLRDSGFVQVRRGAEFIERSAVVSPTVEGARKGVNYECASETVYFDPEAKLYFRETGSFD